MIDKAAPHTETRHTETLHAETVAERRRLADALATLTEQQWARPSLCSEWRVREVVAHVTMPYRLAPEAFGAGLASHGGDFNRYAAQDAKDAAAQLGDAGLLELYRDNIEHRWLPPGGGAAGALSHEVIHGLDVTEPLGLDGPPVGRIAVVLEHAQPTNLAFFGVDLADISLVATDADVTLGSGAPRRLPAKDILLTITGRRPLPS